MSIKPDKNAELSTLVALTQLHKKSFVSQNDITTRGQSPWFEHLAKAIINNAQENLTEPEKKDLLIVHELASHS